MHDYPIQTAQVALPIVEVVANNARIIKEKNQARSEQALEF